jgi:hypothetical protein
MTSEELIATATKNVKDILTHTVKYVPSEKALVVYDTNNGLTEILTDAYKAALPNARYINFDEVTKEEIISAFDEMNECDLVVLIQSSSFLLNAFRIRLHLFNKKLKVIEHMHLYRNHEDVWDVYINAIAYDPDWYRTVGRALKAKLEPTKELVIRGAGQTLTVTGGLESPKLNVGDYTGMENIGGTFPIGEVFTEALSLENMNGSFMIYAFADKDFDLKMYEPFRVDVKEGLVVGWGENAPKAFADTIAMVKEIERPIFREIGFGLNRAITKERYLQDITAFERILGLHFSLGEKHGTYKKDGINVQKSKFHIDVFPVVDEVLADGEVIFQNGKYLV